MRYGRRNNPQHDRRRDHRREHDFFGLWRTGGNRHRGDDKALPRSDLEDREEPVPARECDAEHLEESDGRAGSLRGENAARANTGFQREVLLAWARLGHALDRYDRLLADWRMVQGYGPKYLYGP